jgi:hypothetical protein
MAVVTVEAVVVAPTVVAAMAEAVVSTAEAMAEAVPTLVAMAAVPTVEDTVPTGAELARVAAGTVGAVGIRQQPAVPAPEDLGPSRAEAAPPDPGEPAWLTDNGIPSEAPTLQPG